MRVKTLVAALALAFVAVTAGVALSTAHAKQDDNNENDKKVTICHRTRAVDNPYREITVKQSAVDGIAGNSGKNKNGHNNPDHYGEHKGPLATSVAEAQAIKDSEDKFWGDIIPPVEGFHDGLNWTTQGQRILQENHCKVPETTPEPHTTYNLVCDNAKQNAVITFKNDGTADSTVVLNQAQFTVMADSTVVKTVHTGMTGVTIVISIDGTEVFNSKVTCATTGSTVTTTGSGSTSSTAQSLPNTSAGSDALIAAGLAGTTALGVVLSVIRRTLQAARF